MTTVRGETQGRVLFYLYSLRRVTRTTDTCFNRPSLFGTAESEINAFADLEYAIVNVRADDAERF